MYLAVDVFVKGTLPSNDVFVKGTLPSNDVFVKCTSIDHNLYNQTYLYIPEIRHYLPNLE